jgi:hypothetical protein
VASVVESIINALPQKKELNKARIQIIANNIIKIFADKNLTYGQAKELLSDTCKILRQLQSLVHFKKELLQDRDWGRQQKMVLEIIALFESENLSYEETVEIIFAVNDSLDRLSDLAPIKQA